MEAWGHIKPSAAGGTAFAGPHLLCEHLREVARLAAQFAAVFGCADWAEPAGRWHDLGKYRPGFQRYIRQPRGADAHIEGRVASSDKTHSAAGALHAIQTFGPQHGRMLAFLIAGHHAGLPDLEPSDGGGASLRARLDSLEAQIEFREARNEAIPADLLAGELPRSRPLGDREGFALWIRMLFSALVDADFLDTERYFDPKKFAARGRHPAIADMAAALDAHLARLAEKARVRGESVLNRCRADVLAQCRAKAVLSPGFFTLTVPTGGGKTLSSLTFALTHALAHRKRRIVYAIPYTSIIEQTAQVFREAFADLGGDAVVEHHSNLDVDEKREDHANRLAAENWDAPLIVTTNVQLFESLYAARTSRCRKLHNLAGSVIVLDEAQMLPRDFLAPVLRALKLLVAHYGVTVVLCTATQPMLRSRYEPVTQRRIFEGIDDVREIVDGVSSLFDNLKRVAIHMPTDLRTPTTWETLAVELATHENVLAIVNRRRHARDLYKLLPAQGAEHLSALMCAEHRSAVLGRIRARLAAKREFMGAEPLRVVSTQLVEAGVDIDFPVVYRALAGMDSIAQAAGRCNREGRLPGLGNVHVFVPPQGAPPGLLRQGEQATHELAIGGHLGDPLTPETFHAYFDRFYAQDADGQFDSRKILEMLTLERAAFRSAAEQFRLIDDAGETVIVPFHPQGDNAQSPVHGWLGALAKDGNATWARRKLQRYTVNVPRRDFEALLRQGDIEERAGLWLALDVRYDSRFGLLLPDDQGEPKDYFG